jgi:predicted DNA-binding ribbon-helix-helix protein
LLSANARAARLAFSRIKTDACLMRTTVTIDDDVYLKVKQIAEESGHTFGQVISQLARKGLGAEPLCETESAAPFFRILVGAAMIPGNRTVVFLEEEK